MASVYVAGVSTVETERLVVRAPVEADRLRLVELFTDAAFMAFSDGVHNLESANARFDTMLALARAVPYAKQPVVERATGSIVGYTGVGTTALEGINRLEWGWRFATEARGRGYATEATTALLTVADHRDNGEVLCIVANDNPPSRRVAEKAGFQWWRNYMWPGDSTTFDLLVRPIGKGGSALLAPGASFSATERGQQPFDLGELSRLIDQARRDRDLTWKRLSLEVGVAASTIRRFASAADAEADGVLALIGWLGVAPEDFIANSPVAGIPLPPAGDGQIRVDMSLVIDLSQSLQPRRSKRPVTRTTIQRLASAAQSSGRSVASLTRWSPI